MPILQKKTEVDRIYLPSTKHLPEAEQAFVDMEIGKLTTGDIISVDPKASEVKIGVDMLVSRIKGWNFTDAEGTTLDVNFDTVSMLDIEDFTFLAQKIPQDLEPLSTEEKKT